MILSDRLAGILDAENYSLLQTYERDISEIRIRCGRPFQLSLLNRIQKLGSVVTAVQLERIISILMDDSLYSREQELRQGYFTTAEGCRVGVCGKTVSANGYIENFSDVGSLCIRLPREIHGCVDDMVDALMEKGLKSLLLISSPGMGKTTMLREMALVLSNRGYNVAIADERREIAACVAGVPTMNVGLHTDIMDGCSKKVAIPMLIRACAPDVLIADEIGAEDDANALLDASRCGVKVIASAHGTDFAQLCARKSIAPALHGGAFDYMVLLGPTPGKIKELRKCADGVLKYVEGDFAVCGSTVQRRDRSCTVECAQKANGGHWGHSCGNAGFALAHAEFTGTSGHIAAEI